MPSSEPRARPRPPGIVVGMHAEARLLNGSGLAVAIGGGTPAGATAAAERLLADGAPALISLGLAGGLAPSLRPGACIIPSAVIHDGVTYPADPALLATLGGQTAELLVATGSAVISASDKAALFTATGAAAVDLESGAVAMTAARHGVPFAVLRIVCDPAWRDLPPAALAGLDSSGRIVLLPLLVSLLRAPWQLGALLRLGGDARVARGALAAAVKRLEPGDGVTR